MKNHRSLSRGGRGNKVKFLVRRDGLQGRRWGRLLEQPVPSSPPAPPGPRDSGERSDRS